MFERKIVNKEASHWKAGKSKEVNTRDMGSHEQFDLSKWLVQEENV